MGNFEATNVVHKGNTFTANFSFKICTSHENRLSPEYTIGGSTIFQMMVNFFPIYTNGCSTGLYIVVFLRFTKRLLDDNHTYNMKFTSSELGIQDKCFTSDDGTWHLICDLTHIKSHVPSSQFTFDVVVEMEIAPSAKSFASLHDDTVLTDFELLGEDGSVHMHRVILAAASPVLRTMLGDEWRESAEGSLEVPGTSKVTSKVTLQNFKNYIYLQTLPESGLEELLLLSSFYMMPDLEQRCVDKLMRNLNVETVCELIEFAVKHNMKRLLLASLKWVQSGEVDVDEMVDRFMRTDSESD